MDKLDGKTERECRIEGRWGLLAMPAHTRSRCWDQCLPHRSSEGQRSGTTLEDRSCAISSVGWPAISVSAVPRLYASDGPFFGHRWYQLIFAEAGIAMARFR